ncbi:Alpha-1,3-mannosyltransferase CMT1 [Smittium mucronatum]|uniref:Alpha-1,3-mannosyltransferase CMT1 n=1 Tax=Smittium mucronatum TaxID=133383 RepID=A0A1R0GL71_9FUNG|nr:Alpha-1,3-mannosyltransferase CMT1 [Smittium mucronatum]
MNDIFFCRNDILELIYQSDIQGSDITCPLDFYTTIKANRKFKFKFRDTWVSRDLNGREFNPNMNKLVSHTESKHRFLKNLPFQVQCCWNGVAVLNPNAFYGNTSIRFRRSKKEKSECSASECSLLCNDFWQKGFRKIVVVPKIRVSYMLKDAILSNKRYSDEGLFDTDVDEKIRYIHGPKKYFCKGLEAKNEIHPNNPGVWYEYSTNGTEVL